MEPEEYIEYFEDTILIRTPKSGQKGCYAKVSSQYALTHPFTIPLIESKTTAPFPVLS